MVTRSIVLLSLLLLVSVPCLALRTLKHDVRSNLLQHWLEDPVARQQLYATWKGDSSPLAAAFAALNTSISFSTMSSTSGTTDNERLSFISIGCVFDVYKLLNTRAIWAFQMIDASVKTPVGLLSGVTTHFGNWDECVNRRDIPSFYMSRTFNGQMCMIKIKPQIESRTSEAKGGLLEKPTPFTTPEVSAMLAYLQVSMGVCVPDSCSASDVQKLFQALLDDLKIVDGIELVPSVSDGDCTTKDAPDLGSTDIIAVMVLSILAALVVMSTVYDVVTPAKEQKALPAAFSVISNGRKLLALPRADADHTLSCLHGMRFLSMCWVVLCHRYQFSAYAVNTNPRFLLEVATDFFHLFLSNGTMSVDTFFVLSGLLLAYLFFKQDATKLRFNIPLYYLHRYIRLTPALAMVVLLSTTLLQHVGWGPVWKSNMSGLKEVCEENWWTTLLYVGNYVRPLSQCVSQSWYLMVDMQLHWLSPLVILPLIHVPKVGIVWLVFLCVAGMVSNLLIVILEDLPGSPFEVLNNPDLIAYSQENFYFPTHTRFVPYLIGMGIGYILAVRKKNNGNDKPFSFVISSLGWLIVAGLMLGSLLSYNIFLNPPYPSKWEAAVYGTFQRPMWGLGVALAVYLCAIGNGGTANDILSWWGFHVLGRLTYSVYLVHVVMMTIETGTQKNLLQVGDAEVLVQFSGDLLMALIFAAVLSLVCESPFLVLEKELLSGRSRSKPPASGSSGDPAHILTATSSARTEATVNTPLAVVSVEPIKDLEEQRGSCLIHSATDVNAEFSRELSEPSELASDAHKRVGDV